MRPLSTPHEEFHILSPIRFLPSFQLEEFQGKYSDGGGLVTAGSAVAQAIEGTRNNMAWIQHHRQDIVDLLSSKGFTSQLADL